MIDFSKPIEDLSGNALVLSAERNSVKRKDGGKIAPCGLGRTSFRTVYISVDKPDLGWPGVPLFIRNVAAPPAPALDLDGTLQTADGKPVRLLARNASGEKPLVVEVAYPGRRVAIEQRFADGRTSSITFRTSGDDLVNPVVEAKTYRNLYADGSTGKTAHTTYDAAQRNSKTGKTRVGIIETVTKNGEWFSSKLTTGQPHTRAAA